MSEFKQISKEEFKKIYFDHPDEAMDELSYKNIWDGTYEVEEGVAYTYKEAISADENRMFIVKDYSAKINQNTEYSL